MSSTIEVHNIPSNSFERARSVSRSRGQTAEEKAFEEMKKMLLSYEALTEKLMTENASLSGRVSALESELALVKKIHPDTLQAFKKEASLEVEKLRASISPMLAEYEAKVEAARVAHLAERRKHFISMFQPNLPYLTYTHPRALEIIHRMSLKEVDYCIEKANKGDPKQTTFKIVFNLYDVLMVEIPFQRTFIYQDFFGSGSEEERKRYHEFSVFIRR